MKKLMSLMLGLALVVGTSAVFADTPSDTTKKETKTKAKKGKKTSKKKKTDSTEKKQ